MSVRVDVQRELLVWEVERSGLSSDAVERKFPRLDEWIAGDTQPTFKQLAKFARGTHTPLGYLFLDRPPAEEVPIPDFRTHGDRPLGQQQAISANLREVIYTCQARQEWYREHQIRNGEDPLPFVGSLKSSSSVPAAAGEMADMLGWDSVARGQSRSWADALAQLRERAEIAGVLVMISGMVGSDTSRKLRPDEFRGFALTDRYAPLVFINGADSKSAQVFTLAHELAHLWLGETALSDVDGGVTSPNESERWCNRVAAELLVPIEELRQRIQRARPLSGQIEDLARHFRVSRQVIVGRFFEGGYINWDELGELRAAEQERLAAIAKYADRPSGGNYYTTRPVQVSKRFARALVGSALEGGTTYSTAFRLLGVKKESTFDRLVERLEVA